MIVLERPPWFDLLPDDVQLRRCAWTRYVTRALALHCTRGGSLSALAAATGIHYSTLQVAMNYAQGGVLPHHALDKLELFIGPGFVNGKSLREVLQVF